MSHTQDELKHQAALRAVDYVRPGMNIGLGSGSTAEHAVREIGRRVREEGLQVRGVPTSDAVGHLATEVGIPLLSLDDCPYLDVTIDGADEVNLTTLDAIKGLGGALLREKLVALATRDQILIVDESKVVEGLGHHVPVPVEVVPFGWTHTRDALTALGADPEIRPADNGSGPYLTDSGNYLLDCRFNVIEDPAALAGAIKQITGVIEHGLFIGIVRRVVIAREVGIEVAEQEV